MKTYDLDAVEYIAKLADGGLRDSLSLLDKCLSYSSELTVENIVKALGVADYDTMIELTDVIIHKDEEAIIRIIEEIHSDGKDLKQFVRQYLTFVLEVKKYMILGDFKYLNIPQTNDNERFLDNMLHEYDKISDLLDLLIKINAEIKYDSSPKYMIEAMLLGGVS